MLQQVYVSISLDEVSFIRYFYAVLEKPWDLYLLMLAYLMISFVNTYICISWCQHEVIYIWPHVVARQIFAIHTHVLNILYSALHQFVSVAYTS